MRGNSFKIWSLTLGLLLAPSYLSLTGATRAAPAVVPSVVAPSMPSSVAASVLPSETNVNHQDAINKALNKALERAVNLENEAEVQKLLNIPAGQLGPDERAVNDALAIAKNKKLAHESTFRAFATPLDEEGWHNLLLRSEPVKQKIVTMDKIIIMLEGAARNYKPAVAQTVSPSQAAIPSVVGPSMPSSVPASAGNSPPGGAPFPEEFGPSSTSPTITPPQAPTLADAHIDGSEVDLNRYLEPYAFGRGFDNYTGIAYPEEQGVGR